MTAPRFWDDALTVWRDIDLASWPARERLRLPDAKQQSLRRTSPDEFERPRQPPHHLGLWLNRCLVENPQTPDTDKEKSQPGRRDLFIAAVEALRTDVRGSAADLYRPFYERWQRLTSAGHTPPGRVRREAVVTAVERILLHPATGATVTQSGLLLHHTYGVPYLPGSALKGIARAYLASRFGHYPTLSADLFGTMQGEEEESDDTEKEEGQTNNEPEEQLSGGYFDFYDALWVPEPPDSAHLVEHTPASPFSPLALDIVNPHHSRYNEPGAGPRQEPHGLWAPVPVPTLSIAPGTKFRVVLESDSGPGGLLEQWLDWLMDQVMLPALATEGIGAKTSAGYGRLLTPSGFELWSAQVAERESKAATSGQASAAAPKVDTRPRTERAIGSVYLDPGAGTLTVELKDGRRGFAPRERADVIRAALSEDAASRLRKNKRLLDVAVEIEVEGSMMALVRVDA
jgi:CRISPR-associated protein Cmr6